MNKIIVAIVAILIIAAGAWYFLMNNSSAQAPAVSDATPMPSSAAGLNGSPNQGNLGQPDNGQVQQPLADGAEGSIIGGNVALGVEGGHLIAYNGMTVYAYAKDTKNTSTCYDKCAQNWPPYLVGPEDNVHQLKAGVSDKTDTIIRTDGSIQMTFNGYPLYFYVGDKKSGDTTGQGVGGNWTMLNPTGEQ